MTSRDLFRAAARRWYVLALGLALTVTAALLATQRPGVYFSDVDVVLLAPTSAHRANELENPKQALAPVAGLLVRDWNGTRDPVMTASGSTTLFGEGVREGVQVRVRNDGSQWKPQFFAPVVNVQVVGSDPAAVAATSRRITGQLRALLLDRQVREGVPEPLRITTTSAPASPTVTYVAGQGWRAALAAGVVGLALSCVAVTVVERGVVARSARRRRAPATRPGLVTTART